MLIDVCKVKKDYGYGELFSSISFSINYQDRIALVGRNGCGKSTMLKILAGIERYEGNINIAKDLKIGYLEQTSPDQDDARTITEILHEPFADVYKEMRNLEQMETKMLGLEGEALIKFVEKYSDRQAKFIEDGGYEVETNINYVVNGLKIPKTLLDREYNTLSGGEKTLVHFARILLENPDVLLLDEPTNHLDIERIEWLESYLQKYKGAVVIISHDRYFLDKVVKTIIDIEDNGAIYSGNYSYFVREKENKELREFEQYKNEQKKLEQLKLAVKKLYEWGERSDNPSIFRRAKAIQRRIDFMEENGVKKPTQHKNLSLQVTRAERGGNNVFDIRDFSLMLGEKILFEDVNLNMQVGEKIALIGVNGSGKTSLLKCMMGVITDYFGSIKKGASVSVGYLDQLLTFKNPKQTVLDNVTSETGLRTGEARGELAKYEFFADDIEKSVGSLSGGEKVRLKILCMLSNPINTFIFDEPTNHIDIYTRETLEDAMKKFKGSILFVSHDRYFVNNIATAIWEVKDNKVIRYAGNYDDYKRQISKPEKTIIEESKPIKIKPPKISKGGKWS